MEIDDAMTRHQEKVNRIAQQLTERISTAPLSLKKTTVSHQVPKPKDKKYTDDKLDISDLDEIISIDIEKRECLAEPGATFAAVVDATLKYGLVPVVVPELKTITIGGAVAGCSLESMSYKLGGFHDNCLDYEVVSAKGEVLVCPRITRISCCFTWCTGLLAHWGICRTRFDAENSPLDQHAGNTQTMIAQAES